MSGNLIWGILVKKSFSFVLMGALGFSAAVGATSFGTSTTIDFNEFPDGPSVSGSTEDGFVFGADSARFIAESDSDSDKAVSITTTTISPLDTAQFTAPSRPFFSIEKDNFELFKFSSVTLGGGIFDLDNDDGLLATIDVFGIDADGNDVGKSLSASGSAAGSFNAGLFDLNGVSLKSLSFSSSAPAQLSTGGSGQPSLVSFSDTPATDLTIDDLILEVPSQVPVPASALLLGSVLLGAGAFARRKRKL